jgi:putative glutamine amidotransferase
VRIARSVPIVGVSATTEVIRGVLRVRVNEAYTDALTESGVLPLVIPPLPVTAVEAALDGIDGLLLTGGEDVAPELYGQSVHPTVESHPARDATEVALCLGARRRSLPTLAICRGIQVMNVALGGTLIQDIPSQCAHAIAHDPDVERSARVHEVCVDPDSRLARALGTSRLKSNSSHHQALDRVADPLRVTAHATDGIVEGAESPDENWWMVAVQWHPEELLGTPEPWDRNLFTAFAAAVRRAYEASFQRVSSAT